MPTVTGTNHGDDISPFGVSPGVTGTPSLQESNNIHGGNGDDVLYGGVAGDWIYGGNGADILWGGAVITLHPGDDHLFGGNGDDLLIGSQGNDSLYGENGNDTLLGGSLEYDLGNDFLSGGAGDDVLDGAKGSDTLLGGKGRDTFQFWIGITGPAPSPTSPPGEGNRDVILDFHQGEDVIDLSDYQNFFKEGGDPLFLGTAPFGESSDLQVRYDITGGHTIVQFRSAVNDVWFLPTVGEIDLVGAFHLAASDFHLVS